MSWKTGKQKKFQRDIQEHRRLYEGKNMRRVRENWVFYWRFLAHLEDIGYRPPTVAGYHVRLRMFLVWLGGKSLRRVTRRQVEEYLLYFNSGTHRAAYTVRYVRQSLATFFDWVMRFARMKVNPACGLRIRVHYKQPEKMDLFSRGETAVIVHGPVRDLDRVGRADFPTEHSYQNARYRLKMHYLMLKLLFSTGMRPSEIVGLELKDFQQEELRLRVRNKGNQQYIATDRYVFISERTAEQLQELLRLAAPVRNAESRGKLFIHYFGGGPIAGNYLNTTVKYWAARCGIARGVYAYMARYTYCTRLVENGADLYSLRRLMGHRQTAVTLKHYLKLTAEELRRQWKRFNPLAEGVD